ncbi:hypothetical protein [Listeria ivanovii]|uniref:hypothetical protein n=1 Tax=Listeria ivanovii TaxID=1638 RepID=UPI00194320EE|nr:hypothetical protein [Listeria ivanovii]MBM5721433.1 hypothetical protein [Listeria ivanovii]
MNKKSNDYERAKYNQLILENEQQMDELSNGKRKLEESIYNLEVDFRRGFQELNNLNNENARFDSFETNQLKRHNEEQEQSFRQLLRESNDQIVSAYKNETKKMDEEREILYKKRSDIPWD